MDRPYNYALSKKYGWNLPHDKSTTIVFFKTGFYRNWKFIKLFLECNHCVFYNSRCRIITKMFSRQSILKIIIHIYINRKC